MTDLCLLPRALSETCTVAPKQRANCGYPGVTPSQCAEKGCCFDSSVPGYPWCFHPVKVDNAHERISEGTSVTTLWGRMA